MVWVFECIATCRTYGETACFGMLNSPCGLLPCLQGDVAACSGEVVAAGDARAHQQALELLQWKQ